jgi:hypothetical protein
MVSARSSSLPDIWQACPPIFDRQAGASGGKDFLPHFYIGYLGKFLTLKILLI